MKMLTPRDIADLMQVSYDTALEFIKTSGITYIQVGRQYRVAETVFETFVSGAQQTSVKLDAKNIYSNMNSPKTLKLRRK